MQITFSRYYLLLLLGLVALVLSSCASVLAADPPPQVTPDTTNPSTLKVTITIDDDQNATDGKVGFTMQFATDEISNANFIEFTHGESVKCNDTPLTFNSPKYTARVTRPASNGHFECYYKWHGQSFQFVNLKVRSELNASLETNRNLQNSNFTIDYTPDAGGSCMVNAQLSDSSQTISDPVNNLTKHSFTVSINSLSGVGSLIMTRTCTYNFRGIFTQSDTVDKNAAIPLDTVNITYKSTDRLYETWEPPA